MTAVDIFFVHRILAAALLLTPVKNRRVEQNHLRLGKAAKILLDHGLFASGIVMLCHPPQHPDDHGVAVLPVFPVEFGALQPFRRQLLHRADDFFVATAPDAVQYGNATVEAHLWRIRQKAGVQIIIDHVIHQPQVQIWENAVVQRAVCVPELRQLPVAVHGVGDADLIEQLVDIQKRIAQGRFLQIPPAQFCPPREIPPQLRVGQGLVGGEIAEHLPVVNIVVLVTCQQLSLFDKNGLPGLPVGGHTVFQRAGSQKGRRQRLTGHLGSRLNGFVPENVDVEPFRGLLYTIRIRSVSPLSPICLILSYNICRTQSSTQSIFSQKAAGTGRLGLSHEKACPLTRPDIRRSP